MIHDYSFHSNPRFCFSNAQKIFFFLFFPLAALALGSCSSVGSLFNEDEKPSSRQNGVAKGQTDSSPIDCPLIQIEPGHSMVRSGPDDAALGVKYQISLGEVARECTVSGSQLQIKVGVEVRTVIGSVGTPGNYSAPLLIGVRRLEDEKILTSKTYQVGGTANGGGAAITSIVTDPLAVPYVNEHAADLYEIVMSLGGSGAIIQKERRGKQR